MSGVGKATTLVPRGFELVAYLIKYGNSDLESTAAGGYERVPGEILLLCGSSCCCPDQP